MKRFKKKLKVSLNITNHRRFLTGFMAKENLEKYMKMALNLAKKGDGKVEPNPYVGCVIVKNKRVVSAGYHKFFGGPHAEVLAIKKLKRTPQLLKGSTLFVNLEPCCHTNKKTPPCVPLILQSGISAVVIGIKDPNFDVNGKGIRRLKAGGLKCKIGVMENEAKELNKVYIKNITKKMPYIIMKSAMTLDGKIATKTGDSKWISSAMSRKYVHKLRTSVDAILVGVETIINDDPLLDSHGLGRDPLRIVIDPDFRIPKNSKVMSDNGRTLIVTSKKSASSKKEILSINSKNGIIDFKILLGKLYEKGINNILIEGGGTTNWNAIKSGVVDEVLFFIAPKIVGGIDAKTAIEGEGIKEVSKAIKIVMAESFNIGGDIVIKGKVSR